MPASTAQKLRIKEGYSLLTLNAPHDFKKDLGELPDGVTVSGKATGYHQIHWFVKNRAQMEEELNSVLPLLTDGVVCWIYFPKGTSKTQTDLTRDNGWDALLERNELQRISLISFNDTWSVFGMRLKTETDKNKREKQGERPVFDYIDAATKTVYPPDDFSALLDRHKKEAAFFNALSFTNKKEYVEWIVTARRNGTRQARVKGAVERLAKGWKNPSNR